MSPNAKLYLWDSYYSTGLATLRRDGFVSRRTGNLTASLLTEVVKYSGRFLFVNAAVDGNFTIEVLTPEGEVLKREILHTFDSTRQFMANIEKYANKEVRFRFLMTDGDLFSFWVSPWKSGESRGYLAGGGPGLSPSGIDVPIKD